MTRCKSVLSLTLGAALVGAVALSSPVRAANPQCPVSVNALQMALDGVVNVGNPLTNGGLANHMWGAVVNRDGVVCAVVRTGALGDQWPGSRVIAMQKAYTANAFSLPGGNPMDVGFGAPLSTGNLYGTVLEQGFLLGLQFSNPVHTAAAYSGNPNTYGGASDPAVGETVGGVNVFGGGLALYDSSQDVVGAIGVSGDTSCTDHVIAWKSRDALGLDFVPGGVASGTDNLIIVASVTPGSFEHPDCDTSGVVSGIINNLPVSHPISP